MSNTESCSFFAHDRWWAAPRRTEQAELSKSISHLGSLSRLFSQTAQQEGRTPFPTSACRGKYLPRYAKPPHPSPRRTERRHDEGKGLMPRLTVAVFISRLVCRRVGPGDWCGAPVWREACEQEPADGSHDRAPLNELSFHDEKRFFAILKV